MSSGTRGREHRRIIAENFTRDSSRWSDEYVRADFNSRRYQRRAAIALAMLESLESLASQPGTLLDMGTGAGLQAAAAHRQGWRVVAMDLTPAMVEGARANPGPRWLVASADAPPFPPASFDAVLMLGLIGYVPDAHQTLRAAAASLRPGGHLVISCHNRPTLFSLVNRATQWLPKKLAGVLRGSGGSAGKNFYSEFNQAWTPGAFEQLLARHGFEKVAHDAVDYGRLRPFGAKLWGEKFDVRLSELLESLARTRYLHGLRRYAFMHVFLVRKAA